MFDIGDVVFAVRKDDSGNPEILHERITGRKIKKGRQVEYFIRKWYIPADSVFAAEDDIPAEYKKAVEKNSKYNEESEPLNELNFEMLYYIADCYTELGCAPTYHEIAIKFDKAMSAVLQSLHKLEKYGLIAIRPNLYRGIILT